VQGDFARAEEFLRAALEDLPDDPGLQVDLVEVVREAGRAEDASALAEGYAERRPDDGRVLEAWGRARIALGDHDGAAAAFRRALGAKSPPPPTGTGHELARAILTKDPSRKREAMEALLSDPTTRRSIDPLELLVRLRTEIGGEDDPSGEALARDETLLRGLRESYALRQIGEARRHLLSDPARALRAASTATESAPDSTEAWRLRGWLELRRGLPERARTSLRRAVETSPDPAAERERARAYLRMAGVDPGLLDSPAEVSPE
jgi:tetratricopeptide (TPR) repeat protein